MCPSLERHLAEEQGTNREQKEYRVGHVGNNSVLLPMFSSTLGEILPVSYGKTCVFEKLYDPCSKEPVYQHGDWK